MYKYVYIIYTDIFIYVYIYIYIYARQCRAYTYPRRQGVYTYKYSKQKNPPPFFFIGWPALPLKKRGAPLKKGGYSPHDPPRSSFHTCSIGLF